MGDVVLAEEAQRRLDDPVGGPDFHAVGRRALGKPEIRPEQLVSSIEEVEEHVHEDRDEAGSEAADAWQDVTAGFVDLGNTLRSYFEDEPDAEQSGEMQSAWHDFTDAAQRLGRSITHAFQDEEVQEGAKRVFGTLIDAVGQTVRNAGGSFHWPPGEAATSRVTDEETEAEPPAEDAP